MTVISSELSLAREALTLLRIRPDRTLECVRQITENLWKADLDFDALDLDRKIPADVMRTHVDVLARNNFSRLRRNGELSRDDHEGLLAELNNLALCRLPPLTPVLPRRWVAQAQAACTPRGPNRAALIRAAALRRLTGKIVRRGTAPDPAI